MTFIINLLIFTLPILTSSSTILNQSNCIKLYMSNNNLFYNNLYCNKILCYSTTNTSICVNKNEIFKPNRLNNHQSDYMFFFMTLFLLLSLLKKIIIIFNNYNINKELDISDLKTFIIDDCSICMNDYKIFTKIRKLKCKHIFHVKCIDEWLLIKNSCPNCREII